MHMASLDERMHHTDALEKDYLDAIAQFDDGRPIKDYPSPMRGGISDIQIYGDKLDEPMERLIKLYIEQNKLDAALELAQRADDLGSKSYRYPPYAVMLYLAKIHIKQGKLDLAKEEVSRLEANFPPRYAPGFVIEVEKTAVEFYKLTGEEAKAAAAEKKVQEFVTKYPDAKAPLTGVKLESSAAPVDFAQPLDADHDLTKICRFPYYPWVANLHGEEGVTTLGIEVDENGDLTKLSVVAAASRLLVPAAEETIASCRFLPQIVDG
jgi:hypothetical protein